jgi:hypothetical protein
LVLNDLDPMNDMVCSLTSAISCEQASRFIETLAPSLFCSLCYDPISAPVGKANQINKREQSTGY